MKSVMNLRDRLVRTLCESSRDDHSDVYWSALAGAILATLSAYVAAHRDEAIERMIDVPLGANIADEK